MKKAPYLRKAALIFVVFSVLLLYFVFKSGWYPPSKLVVRGTAPHEGITILVRWESGEGFNSYERSHFYLGTVWPKSRPEHLVRIKRLEMKNPRSHYSDVRIYSISSDVNGKIPLDRLISENTAIDDNGLFKFKKSGAETEFRISAEKRISLEFPTNYKSGIVQVEVNGVSRKYDLYTGNGAIQKKRIDYWILDPQNRFEISMSVPRYPIRTMVIETKDGNTEVQFENVYLRSEKSEKVFPIPENPRQAMVLDHFDAGRKRFWHPTLFAFQCVFAALSTWILWTLWNIMHRFSGLRDIFVNQKRYVFWALFGGAFVTFSFWLATFWPGMMSIDSLVIWRAAKFPEIMMNVHPVFNEIFFMYLMHIWDHPAVVPLVQLVLTSLLGAHIFFSIHKKGVRLSLLMPFFLLFIFSIPVGLYNIVLWKDIPFALLVVFWAFKLADMAEKKRRGELRNTRQDCAALFLLYIALPLFRHNGAIYLLVIPFLMVCLGIISIKRLAFVAAPLAVVGIAVPVILFSEMQIKGKYYLFEKSKSILKNNVNNSLVSSPVEILGKYSRIFDINKRQGVWDLWHYFLGNQYDYHGLIKPAGWWDAFPYRDPYNHPSDWMYRLGIKLYDFSYKEPWVYLTWNPVYVLFFFLVSLVLLKIFPLSAIFSFIIFIQIAVLLFIVNLNWRYYYFAFLSSFFLIPIMMLDIKNRIIAHQSP